MRVELTSARRAAIAGRRAAELAVMAGGPRGVRYVGPVYMAARAAGHYGRRVQREQLDARAVAEARRLAGVGFCFDPRHAEPCPQPCRACAEECEGMR